MVIRLFKRSPILRKLSNIIGKATDLFTKCKIFNCVLKTNHSKLASYQTNKKPSCLFDKAWNLLIAGVLGTGLFFLYEFFNTHITFDEAMNVFKLGFFTLSRIYILLFFASLIFIPLGVYIGFRPKLTAKAQPIIQFLSSFPANIVFPIFVIVIVKFKLNPDIFLSPLIILGSQWYILFNTIAGVAVFPSDYKDAAVIFNIPRITWWRKVIIPGILPYVVTGLITAAGGAWNASIVAEAVSWGSENVYATGLGAYITQKTVEGNFQHIALGILVMSFYVVLMNNIMWKPLYRYSQEKNEIRINL